MNQETKKYYKMVASLLPVHGKYEKKFLNNFKYSLIEFTVDFPNINYEGLCKEFGGPQDIIANYYSEIDNDYLMKQLRRTRIIRIFIICILALITFLVLYDIVLLYLTHIHGQNVIIMHE